MKKNKNERFFKTYTQGAFSIIEIWVDKYTGVNYMYSASGYGAGLCPLIDKDGKPIISEIKENDS